MKYKQGDVIRIVSGNHKTPVGNIPTMMMTYVGHEAVVEHVDEERKLYQIRVLVPWIRGAIQFNVTDRMIEPEINEKMRIAGMDALLEYEKKSPEDWAGRFVDRIYQAMRAARFETVPSDRALETVIRRIAKESK